VRFALIPAILAAAVLTLTACGDEGEGGEVDVVLKEWAVEPSVDTLPEGPITFNTDNEGPDHDHELVIIKTDFAPDELPTKDDGSVDEDASGLDVKGTVRDIEPGDDSSGVYTLDPGKYVLISNLVNEQDGQDIADYAQGMYAAFTVTESE
jgi:hypothetical protein